MTKQEFTEKVLQKYFNCNCSAAKAIELTKKEFGISDSLVNEYLGGNKDGKVDFSRRELSEG